MKFTAIVMALVATSAHRLVAEPAKKGDIYATTAGTPALPECTGMNGDRKGAADCRQIGRFNGPWPVTDDVQLKA